MFTHIFDVVCMKYKLSFVVNEGEREYDLKSKFQSYTWTQLWAGSCSFKSEPVIQIVSFESKPVKQFVQKLSLQIEEMEQLSSNAKVNFDTI